MNLCVYVMKIDAGLGQEGGFSAEGGGNCLKYLKRMRNRKEGGMEQFFSHFLLYTIARIILSLYYISGLEAAATT